ncbi:MAG: ribonuclease P protein component [Candidatus Omnitrophota bacterium]|nr:ribonuclease P protein component [Candidatus Omnitrophota bacterium]
MRIRHILKSRDFTEIIESGRKVRGRTIAAHFKKDKDSKELTIGIIASKRFIPTAVKRNYIRRLIYAYFREYGDSLAPGVRAVIRVARNVGGIRKNQLAREIREELTRIFHKIS